MGLFDIFKKKKRTLLDEFNDIIDKGSQNTDTPLMCYKMAYVILPQELHQKPNSDPRPHPLSARYCWSTLLHKGLQVFGLHTKAAGRFCISHPHGSSLAEPRILCY